MRRHLTKALLVSSLTLAACDLDTTNPNAPRQEEVVKSAEGLMALGVGVQARFGTSTGNFIYSAGLLTEELGAISTAFSTISDAEGGTVPNNAGLVADFWNSSYRTVKTGNDIIHNIDNAVLLRGTRSGLLGLGYLFKAAAIGELTMGFDSVAIDTYTDPTPSYVGRQTALMFALALLDSAQRAYNDTVPSAQFTSQVLATGLNIPNTILAYKARYHRLLDNWTAALATADSVSRTVFSILQFSAQAQNPLFVVSTGSSGVLPRDDFRLSDTTERQRTAYFVRDTAILGRILTPLDRWVVYGANTSPIPTYYPDEVLLIKAEALVNLGRLTEAQAVVDSVRTDCPGQGRVTTDPGPCLTPQVGPQTAQQLIAEIYRNRRYELFATGLRWEDLRRQGVVGRTRAAKRCWLPYPIGERNANPNVPADREGTEPPTDNAACRDV
jgi:hypothetical protein